MATVLRRGRVVGRRLPARGARRADGTFGVASGDWAIGMRVTDGRLVGRIHALCCDLTDGREYARLYLDGEYHGSPWVLVCSSELYPCGQLEPSTR